MKDIWELKDEKKELESKLKEKSIAKKKAFLFASHYSYLDNKRMQILSIVSTLIVGVILKTFLGEIGILIPYLLWIGYDINRMDDLVEKHNKPIENKLSKINTLIDEHMQVKEAIEHTKHFLGRFNKKAS
jgi:hypothetical protein